IEHASLLLDPRQPRFRIRVVRIAEQALEYDARVVLSNKRRIGALPGNCVGVRARKAHVASAGGLAVLNREFERRQLRTFTGLLSQDLVHRNPGIEPRFTCRRGYVGQETRARFGMRAAWPSGCWHAG